MVRRRWILGVVALLGVLTTPDAPAASISFTGKVEQDFPQVVGNGVLVTPTTAVRAATLPPWMVADRRQTGMNLKDLRFAYDPATDSLAVGVNFTGIGGDTDGNGAVGSVDARSSVAGTFEPLRFGGMQTVSVGLDLNRDQVADLVVGIPLNKPTDPATGRPMDGVQAFTIGRYLDNPNGLPNGYGDTMVGTTNLLDSLGRRSVETSAASPGIEFELKDFTALAKLFNPKFDPTKDSLTVMGFSSDVNAPMIGKSTLYYAFDQPLAQVVPEPATVLGWAVVAGAAAGWRLRRTRRPRSV
jgi:hypothetical protein